MKWIYIPEQAKIDDTILDQIKRYENKYNTEGKEGVTIVRGQYPNLRDAKQADLVILLAHGNDDKITLTGNHRDITAADVADLFRHWAHLPLNHVFIKTISCMGAGMAHIDFANMKTGKPIPLKDLNLANCFAAVLARSLKAEGYDNIMVRGYLGLVTYRNIYKEIVFDSENDTGYYVDDHPNKVHFVKAKDLDQFWFNGNGEKMYDTTVSAKKWYYGR
jgi:hypothetical protein